MREVFANWNTGLLESFLIEITAEILARIDPETDLPLVDVILDKASQKGTGRWTSQEALELGVPIPTITAAVEARSLSADRQTREALSRLYDQVENHQAADKNALTSAAESALYAAEVLTYTQGFNILRAASREYRYGLALHAIARIWRGGCIIRARLLEDIRRAYTDDPEMENLLLHPSIAEKLRWGIRDLRQIVASAAEGGIPAPALSASLAYFEGYRSERLPANLIQAQRDYFGAHTYERIDRPGSFHADWRHFEES
jgi:6-phosphogluconate dehydrogenase